MPGRSLFIAGAAVAVGAALALPLATPAVAAFPGANGRIAFEATVDGNTDIYLVAPGGAPVRITSHPDPERAPAMSPDGTRVAYATSRDDNTDIYVLDLDTGDEQRITSHSGFDGDPSWSPTGDALVYRITRSGLAGIAVRDDLDDPTSERILVDAPGLWESDPAWSPDGTTIAYAATGDDAFFDIYTIPAAGGAPTRLTDDPEYDAFPTWSPDGTRIAFQSTRGRVPPGQSHTSPTSIWAMNAEGSDEALLVPSPEGAADAHASWSPDGTQIAFARGVGGTSHIATAPVAGGPAVLVSDLPGSTLPDWSRPQATTTTASPALLQISPRLRITIGVISATVSRTAGDLPLSGRTVVFTAGGRTLCTATTDAAGLARCTGLATTLAVILAGGYSARHLGDAAFLPSSGTGPLIR